MPGFCWTYRLMVLTLLVGFTACNPPVQEIPSKQTDDVSEKFVKANQYMQRRHQDHIAAFVNRVGWNATVTSSGLWVVLNTQGSGERILSNSRVTFAFESMLLDGTPCYSATEDQPKAITIGKGGAESGVEQGLQMMSEGAEATFIIPPHLAHGNFGDRDRIPGNTVIIYHVKVIEVQ